MAMSTKNLTLAIRAPFYRRFGLGSAIPGGADYSYDNAFQMKWRNAADTADVNVLTVNSSNQTVIDGLQGVVLGSAVTSPIILKTRSSTMTAAGAAVAVDASFTYGEANEWRYTVSSWAGTGNQFQGLYMRVQNDVDNASGSLRGAEVMAVANASGLSSATGVMGEAYVKGDTAETIGSLYGLHGEVSFDAGRANSITLTEAACFRGKVLSGKVADYTKFNGVVLRFGDMDGGSRTFGNGILIADDAETAGTSTLTAGINIDCACTEDIKFQNDDGLSNTVAGYLNTNAGVRIAGTGGAGAASTLTLAYAEVAAAGNTATMTNAPAAGNPAKWLAVWFGATKYVVPLFASA